METLTQDFLWTELIDSLGHTFAERAAMHDRNDAFVADNYALLKEHRLFAALIPSELGGEGLSYPLLCLLIRQMAKSDSSTALAFSMHSHLVAANVWKYKNGKGGEEMLRKVANSQVILISTGANDWLESTGKMEKVPGGFLVKARKDFASQSVAGDLLVTSAAYTDPIEGEQVLHFALSMKAEGVSVLDNWYAMGMRGTGSCTVVLEQVFVPDAAIVLRRPRGAYHPVWNSVLSVALPLIMSVYVGIAEKAAQLALEEVRGKDDVKPHIPFLVGELHNELSTARACLNEMLRINDDLRFQATDAKGQAMLSLKTVVAKACARTLELAMHTMGGKSYYRHQQLERLFRDVQAGAFHPLPEKIQQHFTGLYVMEHGSI